ncbi:RNase H [Lachnospiraceae bacterium A10]|jgi:ribonuclease HI|nr:RNase H [Lachnospiraceae bacterium A10]
MKKAYVVFKGRKPGIYKTWAECKAQVDGFSGPVFRGYESMEEAEAAYAKQDAGYANRYQNSNATYDAASAVSKAKTATTAGSKAAGQVVHRDFKPEYEGEYYEVHSDGGTRGNGTAGAPSGYGYVVVNAKHEIVAEGYGAVIGATNNQMELRGAIEGLKAVPDGAKVYFMTDSQYVYAGFARNFKDEPRYEKWEANGWKNTSKKTPENIELIQEIYALGKAHQLECIPRDYQMLANGRGKYIPIAHGDVPTSEGKWKNPYNKICDALANYGEDDAEAGREGLVQLIADGEKKHPAALFVKDFDENRCGYVVDAAGNTASVN